MINFLTVEQAVKDLKSQLTSGEISQQDFEARLLDMIDLAEDGYYWMFGHKTERWYRHDGVQWVPDEPGEILALLSKDNGNRAQPANSAEQPFNDSSEPGQQAGEDKPADWIWSAAGLAIIGGIGFLVYYATLMA